MYLLYRILFIMLLLLSLASCGEGQWRPFGLSAEEEEQVRLDLSLIDSLMEEHPDSAMIILQRDSALMCRAAKAERMMYSLLKIQADDKLYVTHKSDSTIREVAAYFNEHGNARQQAQAWYLLGRVSYDLHHASSAMSAFRQVLAVDEEIPIVCRYKSRSASWLGDFYEREKMYEKLLACNKQAYHYAERSDRAKELMAYSLRDVGRSFSYLGNNKKAMAYYEKALNIANQISNKGLFAIIEEELSAIYIEEGMLHEAGQILLRPIKWISQENLAPYYYTTGKYYEAKGNIDSAAFYYKKNIAITSMYSKTLTVECLVDLYDRQGNHTEAHKYRELGKVYEDSFTLQKHIEMLDNDKNVEINSEILQRTEEQAHNDRRIAIILVCILCIVTIIVFYKFKRRKEMLSNENKRITGYYKKMHDKDTSRILMLENQNKEQQLVLDSLSSQVQNAKDDVVIASKRTEYEKKVLKEEFLNSSIYQLFHTVSFCPEDNDYHLLEEALDKAYDNFTVRLMQLYPKLSKTDLRICCLLKIDLPLKIIAIILGYSLSNLSTKRARLYKKIFKENGSAEQIDAFIKSF